MIQDAPTTGESDSAFWGAASERRAVSITPLILLSTMDSLILLVEDSPDPITNFTTCSDFLGEIRTNETKSETESIYLSLGMFCPAPFFFYAWVLMTVIASSVPMEYLHWGYLEWKRLNLATDHIPMF